MKTRTANNVSSVIVVTLVSSNLGQQKPDAKGVLGTLRVGQAINIKETGEKYLLTMIDGESKLPQPHTVLEVDQDFVVAKDFTGLNETRIPITSIKAVVRFKGFERK